MKTDLKGKRLQDAEDIEKIMTAELNAVPLEAFVGCFRKLLKRFNKCVQAGEDDFQQK
jgi:hypothetical protein